MTGALAWADRGARQPGPTWACQAEAPPPAPGARRGQEPEQLQSAGRSGQSGQGERPGRPDPEPGPSSLGQEQQPPVWSSAAAGARAPRGGAGLRAGVGGGSEPQLSRSHRLPTLAVVHSQAHPGRGMLGPPRAHTPPTPPPPLWAWEGCGVGEPGSLQKGPAATLRRRPGPRQCPAWASGSTCWPEGRCGPQAFPGEEPAPWGSGLRWPMGSPHTSSCTEGWGDRCAQG